MTTQQSTARIVSTRPLLGHSLALFFVGALFTTSRAGAYGKEESAEKPVAETAVPSGRVAVSPSGPVADGSVVSTPATDPPPDRNPYFPEDFEELCVRVTYTNDDGEEETQECKLEPDDEDDNSEGDVVDPGVIDVDMGDYSIDTCASCGTVNIHAGNIMGGGNITIGSDGTVDVSGSGMGHSASGSGEITGSGTSEDPFRADVEGEAEDDEGNVSTFHITLEWYAC